MNAQELRDAVEAAHTATQSDPDLCQTLWKLRVVELGQLVSETVGVAQKDGDLAGHRHALTLLDLPGYQLLGTLLSANTDVWALLDPQTVEPEQFLDNLELFTVAFPEAFADLTELNQPLEREPGATVLPFTPPGGTVTPLLASPHVVTGEPRYSDDARALLPEVADPFHGEDPADGRTRFLSHAGELFSQNPAMARELSPILLDALKELGKGDQNGRSARTETLSLLHERRYRKGSPALMCFIRDSPELAAVFGGRVAELGECLTDLLDAAQAQTPEFVDAK